MKSNIIYKYFNFTILFLVIVISCGNNDYMEPKNNEQESITFELVAALLQKNLYNELTVYDTFYYLTIPMIYSFSKKNEQTVTVYRKFFKNLANNYSIENLNLGRLNTLQFLYFASLYLVLKKKYYDSDNIKLQDLITEYLRKIWNSPAWQWSVCGTKIFPNMKSRLDYKISKEIIPPKSYCKAILDEELFLFGIASNLRFVGIKEPFIEEILNYVKLIVKTQIKFTEDGVFLFQEGVWEDHPDYKYACYSKLPLPKNPKPCKGITSDTSHAMRWPIIFLSLYLGAQNEKDRKLYYNILIHLERQFLKNILVYPSDNFNSYRTKNFTNGKNGFYRVGYPTTPEGYGPYELSGSTLLGFWSILPSKKVNQVYRYIYLNFDNFSIEKELYKKAFYTKRNKDVIFEQAFENGLLKTILYCASNLSDFKSTLYNVSEED